MAQDLPAPSIVSTSTQALGSGAGYLDHRLIRRLAGMSLQLLAPSDDTALGDTAEAAVAS
jgi:hypothetical protein